MGIKPNNVAKTVTTAGTRVAVSATDLYVTSVYFEAKSTNTGVIFVGDSSVSSALYVTRLAAGAGFSLSAADGTGKASSSSGGGEINLKEVYLDSSVNGDICMVGYLQRVGSS